MHYFIEPNKFTMRRNSVDVKKPKLKINIKSKTPGLIPLNLDLIKKPHKVRFIDDPTKDIIWTKRNQNRSV